MTKVKKLIASTLIVFPIFTILISLANPASARQLTKEERKFYAQNNIIFTVPCDSEADCASSDSESTDPDTPSEEDTSFPSSAGAQLIVDFAIKAAWPNSSGQCYDVNNNTYTTWELGDRDAKPAGCKKTINDFAKNNGGDVKRLTDCGRFVGFVLQKTVDPKASYGGTYSQTDHFDSSEGQKKWKKVSTDGQAFPEAKLQPGDILVYGDRNADQNGGHILIYIGEHTVKCTGNKTCVANTVEASIGGRTPNLYKLWNGTYMDRKKTKPYKVYRYIGT